MKKMISTGFATLFSAGLMTSMGVGSLQNFLKGKEKIDSDLRLNNFNLSSTAASDSSIDKQVEEILSTVTQGTYLGNLEKATSYGDLKSIDVSKLINLDDASGKVVPAYLKVDGNYTSDINEAKRSHVQNPVIKYLDNNGKVYDTESEATKAMILDEESYSNGIAYYQIQDFSNSSKPIYNINPLNTTDVDKLKELGYANAGISGSKFNVMRIQSNGSRYNKSDYKGQSTQFINNKVNTLINDLIQLVYDNSLFTITNSFGHYEWYFGYGNKLVYTNTVRDYFGVSDSALQNLYDESIKDLRRFSSSSKFDSFQLYVNQQNFSWYDVSSKANAAYNSAYQKIMSYFNNSSDKQQAARQVANIVKTVIGTNFLGNQYVYTDRRSNYDQVKTLIKGKIWGVLREQFNKVFNNSKTGYATINDYLSANMKDIFQENVNKNGNNVKYVITYNGSPLFLIGDSIINSIKNDDTFRVDPVLGIKNKLVSNSKSNSNWRNDAKSSLSNISNTFYYDNSKNLILTNANLLTNYNTQNKYSNFSFNNSSSSSSFGTNVKLIDETVYSKNNINKSNLEKQLNRREDEDKSLLNNPYGTYQAIYQYNKTLQKLINTNNPSQALINNVNNMSIKDTNNVVFLYSENKTPATIRYGKYINYGTKFNVSLTDNNSKVIGSSQALSSEFYLENIGVPRKQYNFYDYSGNLITSEIINSVNGDFSESEKNAWDNALKMVDVKASNDYVYYAPTDQAQSPQLVENYINKLYVCFISSQTALNTSHYSSFALKSSTEGQYFGFTSYDELKIFVENYVNTINGILPPTGVLPPTINLNRSFYQDIIIGAWSSLGLIIILAGFSALYFYNISNSKLKINSKSRQKYNALKYTSSINLNR